MRDPATGEIKWGKFTGRDTTRGLCAKIDPRYEGNQCWVMDDGIYTMEGELINEKGPESIDLLFGGTATLSVNFLTTN